MSCTVHPALGRGIPAGALAKVVLESLKAGVKGGLIGAQMGEQFDEQFPTSKRCLDCGQTFVAKQTSN